MTEKKTAAEAQEIEATSDGYVLVPLTGYDGVTKDVHVQLAGRWRSSAMRAMNVRGDVDAFMASILHEDDYETYLDLDPTQDGVVEFTQEAGRRSGEALGKSGGPSRSSKGTRKR